MHVRRHATLLGTVAAGLLVSVAALPAFAASAPTSTVPADTAACTAARSAQDAYRVGTIAPLAAEWEGLVEEVEERNAGLVQTATDAAVAVEAATASLAAAQQAETEAEVALEAAETSGDADEIAAAQEALGAAQDARGQAEQTLAASTAALAEAEDAVSRIQPEELAEVTGIALLLQEIALGRGFETEESFDAYVDDLRSLDDFPEVVAYADLVEDLGEACFVYDEDEDDDALVVVVQAPTAPAAKPVTARASYTG